VLKSIGQKVPAAPPKISRSDYMTIMIKSPCHILHTQQLAIFYTKCYFATDCLDIV